MSSQANFPVELWREIFTHILNKQVLKECLSVCKTWNLVARSFFPESIYIELNDAHLDLLHRDLERFPGFGQKVTRLTLTHYSSGLSEPSLFRSVVSLCPNLLELLFATNEIYHYLNILNTREALLPNIQKIHVSHLSECSPAIRRFHVWVNYRFRKTITDLEVLDIDANGALDKYTGLVAYARTFPNLKHLKAQSSSFLAINNVSLDLLALLASNRKLESLKLYNIGKITSTLKDLAKNEFGEYPSLKKLKLDAQQIDIGTLKCITSRFTNVNNLRLLTSVILPDDSLTSKEAQDIIDQFQEYSKKVERNNVSYVYENQHYYINNVIKKSIWITNFTIFDPFIEREFVFNEFDEFGNDDELEDMFGDGFDDDGVEDMFGDGFDDYEDMFDSDGFGQYEEEDLEIAYPFGLGYSINTYPDLID
ncbi:uncharacterized protein B0P05DRAFT_638675 [Gilbertella persicaria]|uniref:uncharacterized protein n=1 Tax=Gilbertella persicaria TaxID=101096 RepID=UPI00221ECA4B|nr:uncharacterized protein B0P05DRAFT_638675 [Gilbertella persicaria]KAI8075484.1 hypothetical protein B0P05DRAFT_638675 [Gilbertella persicaria]